MKRLLSLALALVLIFALSTTAFAAPGNGNSNGNGNGNSGNNGNQSDPINTAPLSYPLHQGNGVDPIDWRDYLSGSDFGISEKKGEETFVPGYELGTTGTILWHFVNPDKLGGYANITFVNEEGLLYTVENVLPYKNDQHFAVVTPQGHMLLSAEYFPAQAPKKDATQFNLSHTAGIPLVDKGSLVVTVDVAKQHEKVTYQPVWQQKLQPVWQKEFQPVWQKEFQPVWQLQYAPAYAPVYQRDTGSDDTKTLVSWLGDAAGGKFENSHTYVEVDVAAASAPGGIWFGIADSSPSNRPSGYEYNVQIIDDKLTISFDERLIYANVGAYVVNDPSEFPGNAPAHFGTSYTVDMPAGYGDIVYLYFHNEGGIEWYASDYYWVEDRYIEDRVVVDEFLYNREAEDYFVRNDVIDDYFVKNVLKADFFVRNDFVSSETIIDDYAVDFNLLVTNMYGVEIYSGAIANNGEVVISDLAPGQYTCVLTGDDIETQTLYVNVAAGEQALVAFDAITVIGEDEEIYLDKIYLDPIYLHKIYQKPIYLDKIYLDPIYYEKIYIEPRFDGAPIYLDPIYLN